MVLAATTACGANTRNDTTSLERARAELVAAIGLEPLAGEGNVDFGSIKSKDTPIYVTATGRISREIDDAVATVSSQLPTVGFRAVAPAQPRLGAVAGVNGDLVVEIAVYEKLGSLPDEPGKAYVQLQLGRRHSALAWTQVPDS